MGDSVFLGQSEIAKKVVVVDELKDPTRVPYPAFPTSAGSAHKAIA
jgi:hypothetical protein